MIESLHIPYYEPPVTQPNQETEKKPLADELMQAIESISSDSERHPPDRALQRQILEQLPENLIEELHAHLHVAQIEQDFFAELRGYDKAEVDNGKILRGQVFELLVQVEYQSGADGRSNKILALMHDPARFNLDELGIHRNPDMAYVHIDENSNVVIDAAGECKMGLLNYRAFQQLQERGFRHGLEAMATAINDTPDLASHGLEELAASGARVVIAKDFKQHLMVPRDRDIGRPRSLINQHDFTTNRGVNYKGIAAFEKLLKSDNVELHAAAFSSKEVAVLTDALLEKIEQRMPERPER